MISNISLESIPHDIWSVVFRDFSLTDLRPIALVSQYFYDIAHNERFWAQYPGIPKELRFRINFDTDDGIINGIGQIEQLVKRFMEKGFLQNQVRGLELFFANAPGARIAVYLTHGSANQRQITQRCIFGNEVRNGNVVFPEKTDEPSIPGKNSGCYVKSDENKTVCLIGDRLENWYHSYTSTSTSPDNVLMRSAHAGITHDYKVKRNA